MLPADDVQKPASRSVFPPSLTNQAWLKWAIFDFNYQVEVFKAEVEASKKNWGQFGSPEDLPDDNCVPPPPIVTPKAKSFK